MSENVWVERGASVLMFMPRPASRTIPAKTVLVVDDEPIVRELARRALARQGYRMLEAANGEAALEIFQREPEAIDLLVTDIVLPGINGLELARRVLGQRPQVRVLYMSASNESTLRRWLQGQRPAFLQKPFLMEGLSRKVGDMLTV
jgi:two-component system cell cycle sensor histidine kinase/response regulator CckA